MNTYQQQWLVAQALGRNVETAGGSTGSYGDPVPQTAIDEAPTAKPMSKQQRWMLAAASFTLGFAGGVALSYWAVESNAREYGA